MAVPFRLCDITAEVPAPFFMLEISVLWDVHWLANPIRFGFADARTKHVRVTEELCIDSGTRHLVTHTTI